VGFLLEPKLAPLLPERRGGPLLWFGVFGPPEKIEAAALEGALTGRAYAGPLRHEWDEAAYEARFARAHDFIAAGDIYQANLSFRSRFAFRGDARALYLRLRGQAGAAHCAYIDDGARQVLSLSPELFFAIDAGGRLSARPMKGTAPRGADDAADADARARLAASRKDRAENLMIVDLLRNDLGRIAEIGSVSVGDLFAVETYPTLHQMVSSVAAKLKPRVDIATILKALFPCGSITGAPKIRAMQIIAALEQSPRGIYCGAIGHFAPDGTASFNVAIRTLTISQGRGELGIGGAVVYDSTATAEYAECLLKARYYEAARRPIALIETLRFQPGAGFVRLSLHMARMERSAGFLALPFDGARALAALERAVAGTTEPLRLRLTLNEEGLFAASAAALGEGARQRRYAVSPKPILSTDELQQHKTNWRELYESEHARLAREAGADEVLFLNEKGEVAEGARSNVFAERNGVLYTPPLSAGVLDGCLRRELIDSGRCTERTLMPEDLARADAVFFGNSLRGLIPAVAV
jgi:para-aminobenzoate synthetase/4-amino-4-deoxychorismate lyase